MPVTSTGSTGYPPQEAFALDPDQRLQKQRLREWVSKTESGLLGSTSGIAGMLRANVPQDGIALDHELQRQRIQEWVAKTNVAQKVLQGIGNFSQAGTHDLQKQRLKDWVAKTDSELSEELGARIALLKAHADKACA